MLFLPLSSLSNFVGSHLAFVLQDNQDFSLEFGRLHERKVPLAGALRLAALAGITRKPATRLWPLVAGRNLWPQHLCRELQNFSLPIRPIQRFNSYQRLGGSGFFFWFAAGSSAGFASTCGRLLHTNLSLLPCRSNCLVCFGRLVS